MRALVVVFIYVREREVRGCRRKKGTTCCDCINIVCYFNHFLVVHVFRTCCHAPPVLSFLFHQAWVITWVGTGVLETEQNASGCITFSNQDTFEPTPATSNPRNRRTCSIRLSSSHVIALSLVVWTRLIQPDPGRGDFISTSSAPLPPSPAQPFLTICSSLPTDSSKRVIYQYLTFLWSPCVH